MQIKRCLRTLGLVAVLGLASLGSGCGQGSQLTDQQNTDQIRESKKAAHQQTKADARRNQADAKRQPSAQKKGVHRGPA
jgi:hypothetical protein